MRALRVKLAYISSLPGQACACCLVSPTNCVFGCVHSRVRHNGRLCGQRLSLCAHLYLKVYAEGSVAQPLEAAVRSPGLLLSVRLGTVRQVLGNRVLQGCLDSIEVAILFINLAVSDWGGNMPKKTARSKIASELATTTLMRSMCFSRYHVWLWIRRYPIGGALV